MNKVQVRSNKRMLILLVTIFILPVIFAKLALEYEWFEKSATNSGELLEPVIDFSPIDERTKVTWKLVYILPDTCDDKCSNALYSIGQIWLALGQKRERVTPSVVITDSSDQKKILELQKNNTINLINIDQLTIERVFKDLSTDGIFVVDTLNNVILRYKLLEQQQQAVLFSRKILADMRKLLKLSRIG